MSSRNKANVEKLFEFWCEVKPIRDVDQGKRTGASAPDRSAILESFPESFRDEKTIIDIPTFAFPCEITCASVQAYSFVLTTDDSKWRYGFCRYDPKTDTAMVIVTYLPWHDTFLRLLSVLGELRNTDKNDFRKLLTEAYQCGVPAPGSKTEISYDRGSRFFVFENPLHFQLPTIEENNNLRLYYNFVEPKNMIAIFAAMLAERRIIFTSNRLDRLSSCIQAANAFLYPMVWQHIFIPLLPMKLKDYLSAPMPYLIGVPELVLETMPKEELGDAVILNCEKKTFQSPFDDVHEMPDKIVTWLKNQLSQSPELRGDRIPKIFLCVLVQLIGGYRDAIEFHGTGSKTFNRDKFIDTRPSHLRPFLAKMMELQIFQQFIDERIEMLNTGLGSSDEFELEIARYADKMKKRGKYQFLKNVKDKTNPAVRSAVKSVQEDVKSAYKDFKSIVRNSTTPNHRHNQNQNSETHFRSHLPSNSQTGKNSGGHHSAPSSPPCNKRIGKSYQNHHQTASGFQYASPTDINDAANVIRKAPLPLAMSRSTTHVQPNGHANFTPSASHHNTHLGTSPTSSPASSLCSSEMNLSQELQNHPLFKSPVVDRSLKPSSSLELNHRITSTRTGGQPPARPPPPMINALLASQRAANNQPGVLPPSYYNHPYVTAQQHQNQLHSKHSHFPSPHAHVEPNKTISDPNILLLQQKTTTVTTSNGISQQLATAQCHTSTPNSKIIATQTIFDNPPDMISPPVPPRRYGGGGSENINFMNRAETWLNEAKLAQKQNKAIELRNSSSSNSSTASALSSSTSASSSDQSFFSTASSFSHKPLHNETTASPTSVPVPTPRLKKESLRSLQPYHLQVPHPTKSSLHSASSFYTSQEDNMSDLISLDDSNNTSYDLKDFDPLNQNARPLPAFHLNNSSGCNGGKKSTTLPTGSSPSLIALASTTTTLIDNLNHPYSSTPGQQRLPLLPPTTKPPPPPTDITSYDDDFELLRKYGLEQLTLPTAEVTAGLTIATTASLSMFQETNGHLPAPKNNSNMSNMNNWTTFD